MFKIIKPTGKTGAHDLTISTLSENIELLEILANLARSRDVSVGLFIEPLERLIRLNKAHRAKLRAISKPLGNLNNEQGAGDE